MKKKIVSKKISLKEINDKNGKYSFLKFDTKTFKNGKAILDKGEYQIFFTVEYNKNILKHYLLELK